MSEEENEIDKEAQEDLGLRVGTDSLTSTISNTDWRKIRERAPSQDYPRQGVTLFKMHESKFTWNSEAKPVDNDLQRIQALLLDVATYCWN